MTDDFLFDAPGSVPTPGGAAAAPFPDDEQTLVTKEGLKKLTEELTYLKTTRRKEVAQRLKEAISYGDLSENSEYEEAKNEQAFVEGRILELERKIKNAKIIADKKTDHRGKEVEIGSSVTVRNKTTREEPETYTIVGATEADPIERKISNESPLGKAFLGKKKDDVVEVNAPNGIFRYEILKVA
ncbi:MAG: transcription elongation factor GreA [Candidatus Peribacteraceae bacterium]|nr:transcription elongation factor GreA [Candidatus Peribacteraceae bacterium]